MNRVASRAHEAGQSIRDAVRPHLSMGVFIDRCVLTHLSRATGWFLCFVCLLLLTSCAQSTKARKEGYRELIAWLDAYALDAETVAVQEWKIWERLTDRSLVTVPLAGNSYTLLRHLQDGHPDYCVTLRSVTWEGVTSSSWFKERYQEVSNAIQHEDPATPLTLYRFLPSPFDAGESVAVHQLLQETGVGMILAEQAVVSSHRLEVAVPVYVNLIFSGNVKEPLTAIWQLRDPASGKVWMRDVRTEPGGLATDNWPINGTVSMRFMMIMPDDLPVGPYALEVNFIRPNLAPFGAPVSVAEFYRLPDVSRKAPNPDYPLGVSLDKISLVGYDAQAHLAPGETLRIALYWHALTKIDENYKVFVHVIAPDGSHAAQSDIIPLYWTYPTTQWQPGEYIRDVHFIKLDDDLPRGDYAVWVGMYDPISQQRIPIRDSDNRPVQDSALQLYTVRVR